MFTTKKKSFAFITISLTMLNGIQKWFRIDWYFTSPVHYLKRSYFRSKDNRGCRLEICETITCASATYIIRTSIKSVKHKDFCVRLEMLLFGYEWNGLQGMTKGPLDAMVSVGLIIWWSRVRFLTVPCWSCLDRAANHHTFYLFITHSSHQS